MKEVNWKFNIGDEIKDDKRDLIIIDENIKPRISKGYTINEKWYKYKCLKCGNEDWISSGHLKCGNGCNVCSGRKAVLGINTIYDLTPWMIDLGVSEKDAKTYKPQSNKKIEVICPHCGNKKSISIYKIYSRHSIGCTCGDGTKFPEKFIYSLLKQLNVDFQNQLSNSTFEWCNNKRYDFYIPNMNMIIETHGEQHYEYTGMSRSLEEEKINDEVKKELALKNGIDNYIVIDCRKSELEWIKSNILSSELAIMFDLSNINWSECEKFAVNTNLIKMACEYKRENPNMTTGEIGNIMNIHRCTIWKWLKKGSKFGWCNYEPIIGKPIKTINIIKS